MSAAVLALALGIAVICDLRVRRIPNWLTGGAALAGLGFSALPGGIGVTESLGGLAVGGLMLLPLYALRAMGAGDVKLMAAAGTVLGTAGAFAATIYACAMGGLLSLLYAARAGVARRMFENLRLFAFVSAVRIAGKDAPCLQDLPLTHVRAPYVLAIAGGALLELLLRQLSSAGM